jgi:intracellular sulfur oxidation DsrE/DsrF family protein
MNQARRIPAILAFAAMGVCCVPAQGADDRDALAGVKELKAVFDIREGDGKTLLNRLMVIEETRESLLAQGVKPRFILTFRGPATKLIQTDASRIRPEDREIAKVIATKLDEMRDAKGVDGIELCEVAIRGQGTKAAHVIPAVKVVGNTFTSLMAYQARGYAYISP